MIAARRNRERIALLLYDYGALIYNPQCSLSAIDYCRQSGRFSIAIKLLMKHVCYIQ